MLRGCWPKPPWEASTDAEGDRASYTGTKPWDAERVKEGAVRVEDSLEVSCFRLISRCAIARIWRRS